MKPIWKKGTARKMFKKDVSGCPKPKLREIGKVGLLKGKRAQAMMLGIMVAIMALLIFIATLPATKSLINNARGCSWLNCNGYIDASATGAACASTNQTYTSALEEDTLSCSILDLAIPFLILGVLIAIIYKVTRGQSEQQPQMYAGY